MFERLGAFGYVRRRGILATAGLFLVFGAVWGTGVFGSLSGTYVDPGSESSRAAARLAETVGGTPDVVLLYASTDRTVDDPAYERGVRDALAALPASYVTARTSYWDTREPTMVSPDRRQTVATVRLAGDTEKERLESYAAVADDLARAPAGLTVARGGAVSTNAQLNDGAAEDIARAEKLSLPLVLVLLVVVFGGLVAASLPLALGGLAVLGAMTLLRLLTSVTEISVFAVNVVTMLGLGLAIDYGLFIVSRFREELSERDDVRQALVRTLATAGRTVAFSGLTVTVSLASLLLFPQVFLRSMGLGGMAAVGCATVIALTALPAALAVLGHRVNALRMPRLLRRRTPAAETGGMWAAVARSVMRRPLRYLLVIVPLLMLLASPFLHVQPGGMGSNALPAASEARQVTEALAGTFGLEDEPIAAVLTPRAGASATAGNELDGYVTRLGALPGVTSASVTGESEGTVRVTVASQLDPLSADGRQLARAVREMPAPAEYDVLVGGRAAVQEDLLSGIISLLPWMAALMALATVVLLFFAFGSVLLPIKAVLTNVLSLGASFGALVWIFQDGHLSDFLNFDPTGSLDPTQPILLLALAFGLSMDYEVFLLSRVREEWLRTGDNTQAVAVGLQRTGSIITNAALLLLLVIGSFSTGGVIFIKMLGVGMLVAIFIDATLVRLLLVPAAMRLMGRWNWWAPRPLARLHERVGFGEGASDPSPSAPAMALSAQ